MWQDEPIEIKRAREQVLKITAACFVVAFIALVITIVTDGHPSLVVIANLAMMSPSLMLTSIYNIREKLIKQRAEDFADLAPVPVYISVIQNEIVTGSDKALVWLKDGRFFFEGMSLSMSLVTRDLRPERVGDELGQLHLRYTLEDRTVDIKMSTGDRGDQHRLEEIFDDWSRSEPVDGDSFLPLGIQDSLTLPEVSDHLYRGWTLLTFVASGVAILRFARTPIECISFFGLLMLGATVVLNLQKKIRRSTDERMAKLDTIAALNSKSGSLVGHML